jgi:hypothetical protein
MRPQKRQNSDPFLESLEARLRAMSPPPVPGDLEARLLADIPLDFSRARPGRGWNSRRRRLAIWAGGVAAIAAACLAAFLLWPATESKLTGLQPGAKPPLRDSAYQVTAQPPGEQGNSTPWLEFRQGLEGSEKPTFTWPIQENVRLRASLSMSSELFD